MRIPITYNLRFFLDTAYDWAWGDADVVVRNFFGQVIETRSDEIDLSALHVMAGFSFVY